MHSRLYQRIMNSRAWKELRTGYLRDHPLCVECQRQGVIRAARCIHHVIPIESAKTDEDAWTLATNRTNLQALCFECHANIHRGERSHSKEAHQQREAERLERWKRRHQRPGVSF